MRISSYYIVFGVIDQFDLFEYSETVDIRKDGYFQWKDKDIASYPHGEGAKRHRVYDKKSD